MEKQSNEELICLWSSFPRHLDVLCWEHSCRRRRRRLGLIYCVCLYIPICRRELSKEISRRRCSLLIRCVREGVGEVMCEEIGLSIMRSAGNRGDI